MKSGLQMEPPDRRRTMEERRGAADQRLSGDGHRKMRPRQPETERTRETARQPETAGVQETDAQESGAYDETPRIRQAEKITEPPRMRLSDNVMMERKGKLHSLREPAAETGTDKQKKRREKTLIEDRDGIYRGNRQGTEDSGADPDAAADTGRWRDAGSPGYPPGSTGDYTAAEGGTPSYGEGKEQRLLFGHDRLKDERDGLQEEVKFTRSRQKKKPTKAGMEKQDEAGKKARKKRIYEEHKNQTESRLKFEESFKAAAKPYGNAAYGIPAHTAERIALKAGRETFRQASEEAADDNPGLQAAGKAQAVSVKLAHAAERMDGIAGRLQERRDGILQARQEPLRGGGKLRFEKMSADGSGRTAAKAMQKKRLKRKYADIFRSESAGREAAGAAISAVKSAAGKAKDAVTAIIRHNKGVLIALGVGGAFLLIFFSAFGVLGSLSDSSGRAVVESTYLASDNAILDADADYCRKEEELEEEISRIESDYPGYDEYRYQLDEITHDGFALTSYLTTLYGNYKAVDVQAELELLFEEQYELALEEETEIRTRTETGTRLVEDEETGEEAEEEYEYEVEYEWHILNVTLTNYGLDYIANERLTDKRRMLYGIYMATLGNRPYLFDVDGIGNPAQGGPGYEIPEEALSDPEFAALIREAEKYLGTPYAWGGYDPSGFDCSGFVSYVLNHCGNGWDFGRLSANGLRHATTNISPSQAGPGDLIFFQGTYNTPGASHVGIYVGNGMMLHCGSPVQYTSTQSAYWQNHLLGYGRLP